MIAKRMSKTLWNGVIFSPFFAVFQPVFGEFTEQEIIPGLGKEQHFAK